MPDGLIVLLALSGGVLPTLLWLWFWLKEDKIQPEPRGLIMLAFFAGMITVLMVIPLEQIAVTFFTGTMLVVVWAAIEELMKYGVATIVVLRNVAVDEPLDPIIYMITIALGFAALENSLFLLNPDLSLFNGIITGNLRFLGATLLHVLASATIGIAMALTFYSKNKISKKMIIWSSVFLSIVLHSLFNFFIIQSSGDKILNVFIAVWIGVIALLLIFEKVKRITRLKIQN